MAIVYQRSKGLTDVETHHCPGCTHGIIHRLVAETLEELDILGKTIGVAPVGCSVSPRLLYCEYAGGCPRSRPAVATGIKRVLPDKVVFTYQGDGDLAAIGTEKSRTQCEREYHDYLCQQRHLGMTGGQMAPQHSSTARYHGASRS